MYKSEVECTSLKQGSPADKDSLKGREGCRWVRDFHRPSSGPEAGLLKFLLPVLELETFSVLTKWIQAIWMDLLRGLALEDGSSWLLFFVGDSLKLRSPA